MPETILKNKIELSFKLNKEMVHGKNGLQEIISSNKFELT